MRRCVACYGQNCTKLLIVGAAAGTHYVDGMMLLVKAAEVAGVIELL